MLITDLASAIDPVRFARESLRFEPDPWQKKVLRYTGSRLMMNCSRQSGKSMTAGLKAYHRAKYYSGSLVLLLSPSLRQSGELFRKVTELTLNDTNPLRKVEDSRLFMTLDNGSRIVSLPGKEGTVRGYSGAALIIIDEASKVPDELYLAIRPMLAVSGGSLILLSTPFGKRGFFFREWMEGGKIWERVRITADSCPRIAKEFLEEERRALPENWFVQEYYCEFVEMEDQAFRYEDIEAAFSHEGKVRPLFGQDTVSDSVKPLFGEDA